MPVVDPALLDVALASALAGDPAPLVALLRAHSDLPGPRGNLELAGQFADAVASLLETPRSEAAWRVVVDLAGVGPEEAPVGDPGEFLAFCGAVAAAGFAARPAYRRLVWETIQRAAEDPRWRQREAAAQAMARALPLDPEGLGILGAWAVGGSWLLCRAVTAGLADPPLLRRPGLAEAALHLHELVAERFAAAANRRDPGFRVLRQGLGYTLSVVVAALPGPGFTLLERLAASADRDLAWVVRSNLGKARLARRYPERVATLRAALDG